MNLVNLWRPVIISMGINARQMIEKGASRSEALADSGTFGYLKMRKGGLLCLEKWEYVENMCRLLVSMALAWAECGFPQLTLSEKLAASLMSTSIPQEYVSEIELPWRCFGISYPPGLIGNHPGMILTLGSRSGRLLSSSFDDHGIGFDDESSITGYAEREVLRSERGGSTPENDPNWEGEETRRVLTRGRLLIGTCIEMATRPAIKSQHQSRSGIRRKHGEPRVWSYVLTRDVKCDARKFVRDYVAHGGRSLSVQTFVRGHYKQQPYGAEMALRKWIHVEPYWRGPEDAPIAIRTHRVGVTK